MRNAGLGAFVGACVGDAAGAVLEFIGRKPTSEEIQKALTMPGGGVLQVAPGQITDDGELALCLARGLVGQKEFDIERIAEKYAAWIASDPFDIGFTTRASLGCHVDPSFGCAESMGRAALKNCMGSKANGSVMRIIPLGIWGHRFSADEVAEFARADSRLSHPNESAADASAVYSIAVSHLMNHVGDRSGAIEAVQAWSEQHACDEVRSWLDDARNNVDVPYHPQVGFVKIAIIHTFRHLHLKTPFVDALTETLAGGGDTDTNACIVGGMIGAAVGFEAIPDSMKEPMLNCDTSTSHRRPEFLSSKDIPHLVTRLLESGQ